jgi:PKD repeat protein
MVMRKKIIVALVCILIITSIALTLGCTDDGGKKKKPNQSPTADIGPNIEEYTLTEIQFSSVNSSDTDGDIVEYLWDFGDYRTSGDETSTEANPSYIYPRPGVFEVSLTITDDDGSTDSDTMKVTILNRPPVVDAGGDTVAMVYEVIYFNGTGSDSDGYITDYEWDFDGDGDYDWFASSTGMTTHFYTKPGTYAATLTVTDDLDEETVAIKNIIITAEPEIPPLADAGLNQSAPVGEILLKGSGFDPDGNINKYEWDFDGDGIYDWSSVETGIVSHRFETEGVFIAKLRVTDDSELTATDTVKIEVNNSILSQLVSASVFINWTTINEYSIVLNNTVNSHHGYNQ